VLPLLYFLRELQEETDRSAPADRIVVVDDASSSLDREALFHLCSRVAVDS
jgi:wobble nucleotide-excising tRNase